MLLLREQDFTASGHDTLDAKSLVMVTLRQATRVGAAVAVMYWLVLGAVGSAARGIFVAALYRYATTKEVAPGFQRDDLAGAWQPKE